MLKLHRNLACVIIGNFALEKKYPSRKCPYLDTIGHFVLKNANISTGLILAKIPAWGAYFGAKICVRVFSHEEFQPGMSPNFSSRHIPIQNS